MWVLLPCRSLFEENLQNGDKDRLLWCLVLLLTQYGTESVAIFLPSAFVCTDTVKFFAVLIFSSVFLSSDTLLCGVVL